MSLLLVAAGAAVGAPLRYLVDRWITRLTGGSFPWGILLVNVLGSFVLGLTATHSDRVVSLLIGVGFCGAFTTYSTFAALTVGLAESQRPRAALANALLSLTACLLAALLGHALST
ncbi:fluoride efflux transporter CrcB [Kribbella sp. NBC_01245]|uniref:fluoride efflux transporter CrcB n=1 Tax=Kribbella sp. NBC_01245 TaxID=2903578 RepID=UPI002E2C4EAD|nr:fluoride efflux transporter CrcB [Kribbella sp. NBC_01245]